MVEETCYVSVNVNIRTLWMSNKTFHKHTFTVTELIFAVSLINYLFDGDLHQILRMYRSAQINGRPCFFSSSFSSFRVKKSRTSNHLFVFFWFSSTKPVFFLACLTWTITPTATSLRFTVFKTLTITYTLLVTWVALAKCNLVSAWPRKLVFSPFI